MMKERNMTNKKRLEDYVEDGIVRLYHENKKLKWSLLPSGNYLLANRSPVRPVRYEFSPKVNVRIIESNTRLGSFVYVCSTNNRKFMFEVDEKDNNEHSI